MKKLFVSLVMLAIITSGSVVFAQEKAKACDKQKTECTKSCTKSDEKKCCKDDEKKCCKQDDEKKCCKNKTGAADDKKCCSEKATKKKVEKKSSGKK